MVKKEGFQLKIEGRDGRASFDFRGTETEAVTTLTILAEKLKEKGIKEEVIRHAVDIAFMSKEEVMRDTLEIIFGMFM